MTRNHKYTIYENLIKKCINVMSSHYALKQLCANFYSVH